MEQLVFAEKMNEIFDLVDDAIINGIVTTKECVDMIRTANEIYSLAIGEPLNKDLRIPIYQRQILNEIKDFAGIINESQKEVLKRLSAEVCRVSSQKFNRLLEDEKNER